jgi:YidC/Oxa1 family membrane protein insertase
MLPPDFLNDPAILDHLTSQFVAASSHYDALSSSMDSVVAHASVSSTSSQFLADAAVEAADKSSWWTSYLAIFKGALNLVHSTIDQPLRSVGIDQTWGISIAIFTAGKCS